MKVKLLNNNQNYSFKGYDVTRLKGFYMQGINTPAEKKIFNEMTKIAKEEHLDLFINQNNTKISKKISENLTSDLKLSIWGQDRKAFVRQKGVDTILENTKEKVLCSSVFSPIGNYKIKSEKFMPRGGNYYIGYKDNDEKWAIVNSTEIYDQSSFDTFGDKPTIELFSKLLDIKPQNVFTINEFFRDIDEVIRPIGYPYVLVNNFNENLKNIDILEKKFPNSKELIAKLRNYSTSQHIENHSEMLKSYGFIPINIGGFYFENINFINALAFINKNNKISYITNSTKGSCPELEYLETLFEKDLKAKVKNIEKIHFVSGGTKEKAQKNNNDIFTVTFPSRGIEYNNSIMDILADRLGGIHCMTAEIPM